LAVICGLLAVVLAQMAPAQLARKGKEKSPRALGLLELAPDGKARLIPITIMVDGKFYDASAYKASPVPLALWSGTVYEADSNGVSQGLFTVGGAVRAGTSWFGDGKWQPAGSAPAKRRDTDTKPVLDQDEGPPKLRRPDAAKSEPPGATPQATAHPSPPPAPPPETKAPAPSDSSSAPPAPSAKSDAPEDAQTASSPTANDTDPNRPVLHRGRTETLGSTPAAKAASKSAATTPVAKADRKASDDKAPDKKATQLIPAISDAGGPDPRPYAYDIKPDEDQKFRKKMLALAAEAVQARAKQFVPEPIPPRSAVHTSTSTRKAPRGPEPKFDDIQFRAFDLWNTNEPVFVLGAKAQMAKGVTKTTEADSDLTYFVTLVAKADIYGDLRKLKTNVTDDHHLDETRRLELIDAVDADGDGRGEFLFREVSNTGSVWAVYRAGADQLIPLFQGTPSGQ
jgi:hypothetical protein